MTYQETLDYLYSQTPMFQRTGADAYKPGLERVEALAAAFGDPHRRFPSVHIAGTNGKGSTAHTMAAVLQSAGYRVGLYTSPHLVDFRERVRVDGEMIPREEVTGFVERYKAMGLDLEPSFFELTMTMAFDYFARCGVDIAVVEAGLGGRLDSTNLLSPRLSIITNISMDHMALLGDTLVAIAGEKAGIIKPGVPVVIGEAEGDVKRLFLETAESRHAPILFAEEMRTATRVEQADGGGWLLGGTPFGDLRLELAGDYQTHNAATVLTALSVLKSQGWEIDNGAVAAGLADVTGLTGLAGRWMTLGRDPLVVCDTGHNVGGWEYLSRHLASYGAGLTMVIGFVSDKDVSHILEMMPRRARYIFTQASVPRAMKADTLAAEAARHGLTGQVVPVVADAVALAIKKSTADNVVFIGGSTFVVGDYLASLAKD